MKKISILILWAALLISCSEKKSVDTVPYAKIETVNVITDAQSRSYPGKTKAAEEINASFRVSGPIIRLHVKEGDHVAKGQLIAEMDPRDYQTQLSATQAEYMHIKADAERIFAIYKEGNTTASNYDKARYGLQQITEKLNNHKNQLKDTKLYSPIDGYVSTRIHDAGETVGAGMPIVSLFSGNDIEVEINVPASDYANRNTFGLAYCTFDVIPGEKYPLTLSRTDQQANPNQLYTMRYRLQTGQSLAKLTPGMSAMVTISTPDNTPEIITVPSNAVFEKDNKSMVFVYNSKDSCVRSRTVVMGNLLLNGNTVIKSGLKDGEQIVTAGVHHLQDGEKVRCMPKASKSNVGGLL